MCIAPSVDAVVLNGEQWVRITEPNGWRNTVTGDTAGEPWMLEELAVQEQAECEGCPDINRG